jgi:plasmid stabilization system protein ParE
MAKQKPPLKIIYSPSATEDLHQIWIRNARERGIDHADTYVAFLKTKIDGLNDQAGKMVFKNPALRYILIRKKKKGHGHIAVFSIDAKAEVMTVATIFNTKQDWQNKHGEDE